MAGCEPGGGTSPDTEFSKALILDFPGSRTLRSKLYFSINLPICRFYSVRACVCLHMCVLVFSHVWLFATLWAVTHQASLSWIPMEFSRQECWSQLPFHSPGDLPNPGIEHGFPALQADSLWSETSGKPKSDRKTITVSYQLWNLKNKTIEWV